MRAPAATRHFAKGLRRKLSLPEALLWRSLKARKPGKPVFRRQHPVGPYVLDFYCSESRLCVEVDGGSHNYDDRRERDERRDAYLEAQGIRVMRLSAAFVLKDFDQALEAINLAAGREDWA